jgi:hypothetical protein
MFIEYNSNDKKNKGTLEAALSCGGGKCGQGYIITTKINQTLKVSKNQRNLDFFK